MKETIARLDATGVTVADLEVVAFRPETEIAAFTAFFETGARLGARHILVAAYDPDAGSFHRSLCGVLRGRGSLRIIGRSRIHALDLGAGPSRPRAGSSKKSERPNAGVLVDALHFDRSGSSIADLAKIPAGQLHYWQLCDGPAERPATSEAMMLAARTERMFPGEGGIDLVCAGARDAAGYRGQC